MLDMYVLQVIIAFVTLSQLEVLADTNTKYRYYRQLQCMENCLKSRSLPTSRQQVVFALLVSSCQQVWNKL
jgi:hypothetical protein